MRLVWFPVGSPNSRAQGDAFGRAQLINAALLRGQDTVEVAPIVELVPNAGDMFSRRWIGLPSSHLRLTDESEGLLRPEGAARR